MSRFRVSQGELWAREYVIEAESIEEAREIYNKYRVTGEEPETMYCYAPDYIDDIAGDEFWWDEKGNSQ